MRDETECEVCKGTPGWYPIINCHGQQLYEIRCPECDGSGYRSVTEGAEKPIE